MTLTDRQGVLEQYRDASNLGVRMRLHERFSTNRYGWHPWVFDQLGLAAGQRVLEIGAGPGSLWLSNFARLPARGEIILSDLSVGMTSEAVRGLGTDGRFRFVVADAQQLPFGDASFDRVIANHMLYHVPDRASALAEIRRVLRPEGRFYAATNGRDHLRELGELVARFAPDWTAWAAGGDSQGYRLENGAEQLARWFPRVELRRYEDALVVTEAEPLLAYVLSGTAGASLDAEAVAALAEHVEAEIAANGAIRITKDTGLFVASPE